MIVSYNMSEMHHFIKLFKGPKSDVFVLVLTFLLTVFADLTLAIQFGVVMSAILFMKRMSEVTETKFIIKEIPENEDEFLYNSILEKEIPKEIEIFEINGPFFFGAASLFKDTMHQVENAPKILLLRMRNVPAIDATGLSALDWIVQKANKEGTTIIISGIRPQPLKALKKSGLFDSIKAENIFDDINKAIEHAKSIVDAL